MPILAALAALWLGLLAIAALVPVSLVLRYRAGTVRRMARGWVAVLNALILATSVVFFLVVAALTSLWVEDALRYALLGLAGGGVLGLAGLWTTRWEAAPETLHYTPNRWLVLAVTLVVTARLLYGAWRGWHAWATRPEDGAWLAAAGVAGSLAAGAVVLGYTLTYWLGVWWRLRRHRPRARHV
ncbi:MAG TPA: DUF1453 domain-containing protein [Vicinamibacteria bacterium]|nr:DUF1453 domain-containing protein [Vicinamibacteria bacterium]